MFMKSNRLRFLGVGFLISALLVAAFAIFAQGHVPGQGVTVQGVFRSNAGSDLTSLETELEAVRAERDTLSEDRTNLNNRITSLSEENEQLKQDLTDLEADAEKLSQDILTIRDYFADDDSIDIDAILAQPSIISTTVTTNEGNSENAEELVSGNFVIENDDSTEDIAQRLVESGYISSTDEFIQLIQEWDLVNDLQAGSYELDTSMSIHDIVTILTQGAYYYY